ncbi:MAG: transketolase family protein [Desulfobacterales bacterium]|nr:transketolase family protein [Desulfobacterales bacterium]
MAPHPNMREAYGLALLELGRKNKDVVALEADLGKSTRSVLFQEAFPERYFQMGIAEQNMAAAAAGLALAGKIPFIHSFAVFATGRAYDQLRNSICIPGLKVRICGSSSGLSDFGDGKTHQSVEDITLMRALPGMTVLSPMDGLETARMMDCLIDWPGPAYIRINRSDLPLLYPAAEPYQIGKITRLRMGSDAALLATGVMVGRSIKAAELLAEKGVAAAVYNISTVKPLDAEALIQAVAGVRAIVVAEEHNRIGGLGSAVLEALRATPHPPVELVGIEDCFGLSAACYDEILNHFGLTTQAVAAAAMRILDGSSRLKGRN